MEELKVIFSFFIVCFFVFSLLLIFVVIRNQSCKTMHRWNNYLCEYTDEEIAIEWNKFRENKDFWYYSYRLCLLHEIKRRKIS